jgi:acyl carrier protein
MENPLEARVRRVLSVLLKLDPSALPADAALGVLAHWDSLKQLEILGAIEQEFSVTIEPDEALDLTSLPALVAFLDGRVA